MTEYFDEMTLISSVLEKNNVAFKNGEDIRLPFI